MKKIILLCLPLFLSGCLGNFTNSGLSASAVSAVSAVGATVLSGNPIVGIAVGSAAGAATDAVVEEPTTTTDISDLTPEDQATYLNKSLMWSAIETLGGYTIAAILAGLTIVPAIIGYFLPNSRQRKLEKRAFNDPSCPHDLKD